MKNKKSKNLIKNPRITEKATNISGENIFVFNVGTFTNKKEIEKSIFSIYKVKPIKINILSIPYKTVTSKGKKSKKGGGKKAIVYFKKGDKIDFIQ